MKITFTGVVWFVSCLLVFIMMVTGDLPYWVGWLVGFVITYIRERERWEEKGEEFLEEHEDSTRFFTPEFLRFLLVYGPSLVWPVFLVIDVLRWFGLMGSGEED